MANFPTSLDSLTNPTANDTLAAVPHHTQHGTVNDIAEALEAKVGIGSSTPTAGSFLVGTATGTSKWQGSYWNVKMSGAVGDGSTDDTAAFRACALLGGRIHVPAGTYIVDWVDLALDIEWYGDGAASIIKKKDNSTGTSLTGDHRSFLFNVTDADITVGFRDLTLDGNYVGQATTYTGSVPANTGGTTNNHNASATVMAVGGAITTIHAVPASSSERLTVRVQDCHIKRCVSYSILMTSTVDIGAHAELKVTGSLFTDFAPGISEYHDGSSSYDGIAGLPAQGYSFSPFGMSPTAIWIADHVRATITGNTFIGTRDPKDGTITTGTDYNMTNLPGQAINVTVIGTTDTTPEWSSLVITGNRFIGLGRTTFQGNGLGVVDFYTRMGPSVISDNIAERCYEAPIRGKSNAADITITGNTITDMLYGGGGISITGSTYPSQRGNYVISGNVVRGASYGINVVGNHEPPENSDGAIADDPDSRVNNVIIKGNDLSELTNSDSAYSVFQNAYAKSGMGIFVRYAADVLIEGNIVMTTAASTSTVGVERGIWVKDCIGDLRIEGNLVGDTDADGIYVEGHVGTVVVTDNGAADVTEYGIFVATTGASAVTDNEVVGTTLSGIVAGSSGTTDLLIEGNRVRDVAASTSSNVYGIDTGATPSGSTIVRGNHVEDVANAGAGNAYGMRVQFSSLADTNTADISGNTIDDTDESGIYLNLVTGTIAGNTFKSCNTSGSTAQGAIFINGVANTGILRVIGNTTDATTTPFPTTGGAAGTTMRNGRVLHEVGNSWQPIETNRSAAPTSGTWAVGDIVWNTTPTSGGTIGWVCTTAGTPGTWKAFGSIA